jgi:protein ImuB
MRPFGTSRQCTGKSAGAPSLAFRAIRPPLAAKLQGDFVSAPGVRGKIVQQAGPWRTSGDWWMTASWARDEWDVELSDGGLYRVYCDANTGRWFIEGSYD